MDQTAQYPRTWWIKPACLLSVLAIGLIGGCGGNKKPVIETRKYVKLPPKQVPSYLKDTVFEYTDLTNTEVYPVGGYGLVVGLPGTGGNDLVPSIIRSYMIDEMVRHGFDQMRVDEKYRKMKPEDILASRAVSVVVVMGYLPPGARKGQHMDVYVSSLPDSNTTSLGRGVLYQMELFDGYPNPFTPRRVNPLAAAKGDLFVNPAYALGSTAATRPSGRSSLRTGTIMDGGVIRQDRPLILRLRQPESRVARALEGRINLAFPKGRDEMATAQAQDEGMVYLYVPRSFDGDWEHFRQIVQHLYMDARAETSAVKARELVAEAVKPGALLGDITYSWEGLGEQALPFIQPLYTHASQDVAFAAARAAAFIGDPSAAAALLDMARAENHPFQLTAVKVLGQLPPAPRIQMMLEELLNSKQTLVRAEAYQILARQQYPKIQTQVLARAMDPSDQPFVLDLVPSQGPPMIYATRVGIPRLAIFGRDIPLQPSVLFSAFDYRLTISSNDQDQRLVNVFYRGEELPKAVNVVSRAEVRELVWRLGGGTPDGFRFSYAEIVGILQALSDRRDIAAQVVLQDLPRMEDWLDSAPALPERRTRPQTDEAGPVGAADAAPADGQARH